jgi:hypothetical protein
MKVSLAIVLIVAASAGAFFCSLRAAQTATTRMASAENTAAFRPVVVLGSAAADIETGWRALALFCP